MRMRPLGPSHGVLSQEVALAPDGIRRGPTHPRTARSRMVISMLGIQG